MHNAPNLGFKVHSLPLLLFGAYYLSHLLFCSLQDNYKTCTVVSHPFASVTFRDNQNLILYLVLIARTTYTY